MESTKLKQIMWLCSVSLSAGFVFGLMVHQKLREGVETGLISGISSLIGVAVADKRDFQEKVETGVVNASSKVADALFNVKSQIQDQIQAAKEQKQLNQSYSQKMAVLPEMQVNDPANNWQNESAQVINPPVSQAYPQQEAESQYQQYQYLQRQLQQLQNQNQGLQTQLQQLQNQNQGLQNQLNIPEQQRQEWNQALESLDEHSPAFESNLPQEEVQLDQLVDNVPTSLKKQVQQQVQANPLDDQAEFEQALTAVSQKLQKPQTPEEPQQIPTKQETPLEEIQANINIPEESLEPDQLSVEVFDPQEQLDQDIEDSLPDELIEELDELIESNSQIEIPLQPEEEVKADEPNEPIQLDDLMTQVSGALEEPSSEQKQKQKQGIEAILTNEQAEFEQLFGSVSDSQQGQNKKSG